MDLTKREREILEFIYEGLSSGQIADRLFISDLTVKTHCRNMRMKVGVRNKMGLVRVALQSGVLSWDREKRS